MPSNYRRRSKSYGSRKRSTERIIRAGSATVNGLTTIGAYVWTATVPGTVSQFKLDTGINGESINSYLAYVLVYVPEGYSWNNITYPATTDDLYNPTKNVLISGILNNVESEDHKSTRYGRKVSIGDRIALLYYNPTSSSSEQATFELNFTLSV